MERFQLKKPFLLEEHATKQFAWAQNNVDPNWTNDILSGKAYVWGFVLVPGVLPRNVKHSIKLLLGVFGVLHPQHDWNKLNVL